VCRVAEWLEIGPEDRILGHLPLFHVAGVFSSFSLALVTGAALVQLDRWEAAEALRLVEQERISVLSGIPTHFVDLLGSPELPRRDTSSLRTGWIGGSYIPAEVLRGARELLGVQALLPVYGMTELTSCTTLGRRTDPEDSVLLGKGVPLGGYEVAVVDPGSRRPVETGVEGEVAVRGYTVMQGYYEDPEATAAVLDADGWFYTGDLGVLDDDGYLRITGRRTDMFIVGGNNVNPADIERVLLQHPAVADAHVAPRPDDRLGEVAVAFVQVVDGQALSEQDVLAYTAERLASFKVPRRVVFLDEWPMTPTGKVQRGRLREMAAGRS
jgi:fatty-acyl-CoA synthase